MAPDPAGFDDRDQRCQLGFLATSPQFELTESFGDLGIVEPHQLVHEVGKHDLRIPNICSRSNRHGHKFFGGRPSDPVEIGWQMLRLRAWSVGGVPFFEPSR